MRDQERGVAELNVAVVYTKLPISVIAKCENMAQMCQKTSEVEPA